MPFLLRNVFRWGKKEKIQNPDEGSALQNSYSRSEGLEMYKPFVNIGFPWCVDATGATKS